MKLAPGGIWRSATVAVPAGATVAGIHAHGPMPATVELRAAAGWVTLDAVGGGFTEPVWIGRARHVQVRVRGGSGGIGVVFVRPGADPPSVRAARAKVADPGQPPIISRAGWGADESIRRGSPFYFDRLGVVFVHHTDSASQYSAADVPSLIRGFYRFHVLHPRLVRHRLQLPRRPLRPHLRGPVGRDHEERPRRAGGRAQHRLGRDRADRHLHHDRPDDGADGGAARPHHLAPRPRPPRPNRHVAPRLRRQRPVRGRDDRAAERHLGPPRRRLHGLPRHARLPEAAGAAGGDRGAAAAAHLQPGGGTGRARPVHRPAAGAVHRPPLERLAVARHRRGRGGSAGT